MEFDDVLAPRCPSNIIVFNGALPNATLEHIEKGRAETVPEQ
jgi:hypothetical protein